MIYKKSFLNFFRVYFFLCGQIPLKSSLVLSYISILFWPVGPKAVKNSAGTLFHRPHGFYKNLKSTKHENKTSMDVLFHENKASMDALFRLKDEMYKKIIQEKIKKNK